MAATRRRTLTPILKANRPEILMTILAGDAVAETTGDPQVPAKLRAHRNPMAMLDQAGRHSLQAAILVMAAIRVSQTVRGHHLQHLVATAALVAKAALVVSRDTSRVAAIRLEGTADLVAKVPSVASKTRVQAGSLAVLAARAALVAKALVGNRMHLVATRVALLASKVVLEASKANRAKALVASRVGMVLSLAA